MSFLDDLEKFSAGKWMGYTSYIETGSCAGVGFQPKKMFFTATQNPGYFQINGRKAIYTLENGLYIKVWQEQDCTFDGASYLANKCKMTGDDQNPEGTFVLEVDFTRNLKEAVTRDGTPIYEATQKINDKFIMATKHSLSIKELSETQFLERCATVDLIEKETSQRSASLIDYVLYHQPVVKIKEILDKLRQIPRSKLNPRPYAYQDLSI